MPDKYVTNFNMFDGTNVKIKDAELTERVTVLENSSNLSGRKFIFVGDSYNEGWTPDGTNPGWGQNCINLLGLTTGTNAWNVYYGGAGFNYSNDNPMSFYYQIKALGDSMTSAVKNSITDIVIGGGRNDATASTTSVVNGMNEVASYCKANFPNARRWLFAMGWDGLSEIRHSLITRYYEAYSRSSNGNFIYNEIYYQLQDSEYMASDRKHPTANGNYLLGITICQYLIGGETTQDASRVDFNVDGTKRGYVFKTKDTVFIVNTHPFDIIPSNGISHTAHTNSGAKINAKYLFGTQPDSAGCFDIPAMLHSTSNGVTNYFDTTLSVKLIPNSDNNKLMDIYFRHHCINASRTNYLSDSSITKIEVDPFLVAIPIQIA